MQTYKIQDKNLWIKPQLIYVLDGMVVGGRVNPDNGLTEYDCDPEKFDSSIYEWIKKVK